MMLVYQPCAMSRAMTRERFKEIWRWKRRTERRFRENEERQIAAIERAPSWLRREMISRIANPPIMLVPTE